MLTLSVQSSKFYSAYEFGAGYQYRIAMVKAHFGELALENKEKSFSSDFNELKGNHHTPKQMIFSFEENFCKLSIHQRKFQFSKHVFVLISNVQIYQTKIETKVSARNQIFREFLYLNWLLRCESPINIVTNKLLRTEEKGWSKS